MTFNYQINDSIKLFIIKPTNRWLSKLNEYINICTYIKFQVPEKPQVLDCSEFRKAKKRIIIKYYLKLAAMDDDINIIAYMHVGFPWRDIYINLQGSKSFRKHDVDMRRMVLHSFYIMMVRKILSSSCGMHIHIIGIVHIMQ